MFLFSPLHFLSAIAFLFVTVCTHARHPNIIIILSDDHGYTDLGIHGIDPNVQTPAMDALAAREAKSYLTHRFFYLSKSAVRFT